MKLEIQAHYEQPSEYYDVLEEVLVMIDKYDNDEKIDDISYHLIMDGTRRRIIKIS
jgi:predicted Zn-dependent protease with MMP-like domain